MSAGVATRSPFSLTGAAGSIRPSKDNLQQHGVSPLPSSVARLSTVGYG